MVASVFAVKNIFLLVALMVGMVAMVEMFFSKPTKELTPS